ncbi:hypothetical protein [Archangium lipolyticum]|uniref:hypothetical protein n=1 Tax=Archangium lipolyticum TaxID=2970465 RepID=UPI00214A5E2A|nr:hypothetical protein [Archangium lipolyticum]
MIQLTDRNQELSTSDIQTLLGTFEVGTGRVWTFPHPSEGDGRVGKLCVSTFRRIPVAGATQDLALHVTFQIPTLIIPSIGGVRRDRRVDVRLTVSNLHLTARPVSSQLIISEDGSSVVQSKVSIHRGANNAWSRLGEADKMTDLAAALGMSVANAQTNIPTALADYNGVYIQELGPLLVTRLERKIKDRLGISGPIDPSDPKKGTLDSLPFTVIVTPTNWV